MNEKRIVREIRIAKRLLGFGDAWSKGYSVGTKAAGELDWGVGGVLTVATYLAEKSGVPEIKRLKGPILRTESKDFMGGFEGDQAMKVSKDVLRKVKRLGPMGILGAMAGVTEDANAHRAAGLAYELTEQMEKKVASSRVAGDEWVDKETEEFAKQVARVMNSDSDIASARASGNKIDFVHSPSPLITVPLVMELQEFGFGGESESVNGRIFSEEVRNFRIPGGYTRKRDPKELWKHAKDSLVDIMRRAM